jgi:hypothetical protein
LAGLALERRRFEDAHQAFDDTADALQPLARQLVGDEIEAAAALAEQDKGIGAAVLGGVALPKLHFLGLGGKHQAAEAGAQVRRGERTTRARSLAAADAAEHMHALAGIAQSKMVGSRQLQQFRVEIGDVAHRLLAPARSRNRECHHHNGSRDRRRRKIIPLWSQFLRQLRDEAMPRQDGNDSPGFLQALVAGIGDAIADIRHKLVEEGWFGRAVTPEPIDHEASSFYRPVLPQRADSFEAQWAPREHVPEEREQAPERPGPGIDL